MTHNHLCRDCGAVLYSCDWEWEDDHNSEAHRIGGRCPDCQRKAGEFWALEAATSYGIEITRARYQLDAEKYTAEYRPYAMRGVEGERTKLPCITWEDMPARPYDGEFSGCANKVWILTDAERAEYIALNNQRQAAKDAKTAEEQLRQDEERAAEAARKEAIRAGIRADEVRRQDITDESGKTTKYHHAITCLDGETLRFCERNIFDVGVVVNPEYSVCPGYPAGGLCGRDETGVRVWRDFRDVTTGWQTVRPLTANEIAAVDYIDAFGGFAGSGIRI